MSWGGRREGGACLGTHVRIKDFKIKKKNTKEKKKEKNKVTKIIKYIYMKFALKIGSFFCKVIVGYKNEN